VKFFVIDNASYNAPCDGFMRLIVRFIALI